MRDGANGYRPSKIRVAAERVPRPDPEKALVDRMRLVRRIIVDTSANFLHKTECAMDAVPSPFR